MFKFSLFGDPAFADSAEQKYVVNILEREERKVARAYLLLACFAWIPLVAMRLTGHIDFYTSTILTGFHGLKAVFSVILLSGERSPRTLKRAVFWLLLSAQIVWTIGAFVGSMDSSGPKWLSTYWIVLILVGNFFLPVRSYGHNLIFAISLVTSVFALRDYPRPVVSCILANIGLLIAQNYRLYTHRMIKQSAISRFREQTRFIPRQVLLASSQADKDIYEVFKPSNRFCVCICSDWRNFQVLSGNVSFSELGSGLSGYYEAIVAMLHKTLPGGEFFVDWIADELFVVIFGKDEQFDARLVDAGLEVSEQVLAIRMDFFARTGFPEGVDIGISCGIASVGIFGAEGVAKATAFGLPTRVSRALQSLGKDLRSISGNHDRIVVLPAIAKNMKNRSRTFESFRVRDIDEDGILEEIGVETVFVSSPCETRVNAA